MDDLRDYFRENRTAFDVQEPPEGHFSRFEGRLKGASRPQTIGIRITIAAASLILLVAAGWQLTSVKGSGKKDPEATRIYYQKKMDEKLTAIECKLTYADPETRLNLEEDLLELRSENEQFINQMLRDKSPETSIKFMKRHYQAKLNALSLIDNKLGTYIKC